MQGKYIARIVDVHDEGIRLEPTPDAQIPDQPTEVNLLAMAVALALGTAAYEHHPEPRNPEIQTLGALLTGETTMPWRARPGGDPETAQIVCELTDAGVPKCRVVTTAE